MLISSQPGMNNEGQSLQDPIRFKRVSLMEEEMALAPSKVKK